MKHPTPEQLEEVAEKKATRRRKKKHPKMRVHSAGLRDLTRRLSERKPRKPKRK